MLPIASGRDLPVQIHHGTRPERALLKPVARDWYARSIAWPTTGFWTSSFDAATGTTAFHTYHGHYDCDPGVADWQLTPRPDARILTLATPTDYDVLRASPLCEQVGGRFFPTWRIRWDQLAGRYDALRVLPGLTSVLQRQSRSAIPWWAREATLWFDWYFTHVARAPHVGWGMQDATTLAHPDDVQAVRFGIPLPPAFRPDLRDGSLTIPLDAHPDELGLVVALARLALVARRMTHLWPETTDAATRNQLYADHRFTGVVLVEQRHAVGIAITLTTSRWGYGHVDDGGFGLTPRNGAFRQLEAIISHSESFRRWAVCQRPNERSPQRVDQSIAPAVPVVCALRTWSCAAGIVS